MKTKNFRLVAAVALCESPNEHCGNHTRRAERARACEETAESAPCAQRSRLRDSCERRRRRSRRPPARHDGCVRKWQESAHAIVPPRLHCLKAKQYKKHTHTARGFRLMSRRFKVTKRLLTTKSASQLSDARRLVAWKNSVSLSSRTLGDDDVLPI